MDTNYVIREIRAASAKARETVEKVRDEATRAADYARMGMPQGLSLSFLAKYAGEAAEADARLRALCDAAYAMGVSEEDVAAAARQGARG